MTDGLRGRLRAAAEPAAALLFAGGLLRLLFLGSRSVWSDEGSTLMLAGVPLSRLAGYLARDEIMPPLFAVLMHFWVRLFSDPKIAIRLFSASCGIAALVVFRGLVGRSLPPKARAFALFLAAASSYWIHLAQDGRMYGLLTLLSVVQARIVFELSERPSARLWAGYAAIAAAGLYTHYYFAVMLAVHASWLIWNGRRAPRVLASCAAAHAAAAAAVWPGVHQQAAQNRGAR
ncbi:MAG: glycosyltransferase family 39 protein, partial [Elusimicrobiota bacterium]